MASNTVEGYKKAIDYFNQAVKVDGKYGLAHSGLADCYFSLAVMGYFTPKEGFLKAKEEALKALEFDPSLANPHHTLGAFKMAMEYDWAGAETEYKRSIELDPANWPYHSRAKVLWYQGRNYEAMAQVTRSLELDPTDFWANDSRWAALFFAKRYEEAIEQLQKMLQMDPNNGEVHGNLGIVYRLIRRYPEAIAEMQRGIDLLGEYRDEPTPNSFLADIYAASGNPGEANKILAQLKEQSKHRYVDPYDIARIYIGLGEKDLAFDELEKGYEDRSFGMVQLKVDPLLDPIRSDSRFKDLLARVGLDK